MTILLKNKKNSQLDTCLDVHLEWNWSHVRMEVEECSSTATEPLRDVLGIGQRRAQCHDANCLSDLRRYVSHSRTDYFKHRLHNHQHIST